MSAKKPNVLPLKRQANDPGHSALQGPTLAKVVEAEDGRARRIQCHDRAATLAVEGQSAAVPALAGGDEVVVEHIAGLGLMITHRLLGEGETPSWSVRDGHISLSAREALRLSVAGKQDDDGQEIAIHADGLSIRADQAGMKFERECRLEAYPIQLNPDQDGD